ncbi:MAG: hypothetical protein IJQ04_02715 [Prevotella sp.]|nr:hypothetical protein [Prevotella sp.]
MKRLLYIIGVILLLGCVERREYRETLSRAVAVMNDCPDSALLILDSLGQHEKEFGRHFRMQYLLHRMNAQNKTDVTFTSDSLAKELVGHFDNHGITNEQVLAHYLLGRALSDMGEAPAALQAYYDAIEHADTTKADCDYKTLRAIYGQMATIFHQQNLPHDEIWAFRHYINCEQRVSDREEYVVSKSQLIRPYYLLGEKDTVLQIINDTYHSLKRIGKDQRAASILPTSIYIYMERQELSKAKLIMDIFEHESGLFDVNGNIAKNRESYYYTKGFYELAMHEVDSAEFYFRKAIQSGYLSEGYKGLLAVYKAKNNTDSIVHYANLYEAAQDTLHNKMQTDAIHQMSALYNYNRSQREAEQERAKAQEAFILLGYIIFLTIGLLIVILAIITLYRKTQKEKQEKIVQLENALISARQQRSAVQEELRMLKEKDFEGMIAEKEKQEAELTQTIERLQTENDKYRHYKETDHLDAFLESKIAKLFIKKANGKAERPVPSDAEWRLLVSQFSKDMPAIYRSFGRGEALSPMEQYVCILILLKIQTSTIILMVNSTPQTVSKAKSRANMKLFHSKGANTLENNLFSSLNWR